LFLFLDIEQEIRYDEAKGCSA